MMEDLLQSQIKESCNLALPDGLKELMSDISREVLRAQPNNLYSFIADYLSALLVTRENMSIVTRVCDDSCAGCCLPELEDELKYLGLDEEDAASAKDIIVEYFNNSNEGKISEGNLIMKLMKKTSLDINLLPQVQTAIRHAFQRHQANHTVLYETSSDSDKDEAERAVRHTIQLYRKTNPNVEDLNEKAAKIQAAYRAYGVRKNRVKPQAQVPKVSETIRKNITFEPSVVHNTTQLDEPKLSSTCNENLTCSIKTVSSICLAGSYLHLPKHTPYSVHEPDHYLSEDVDIQKKHVIGCAIEKIHKVTVLNEERKVNEENIKAEDSAVDLNNEIEDKATDAVIESEESVHEFINEEFQNESDSEENILTD